MIRLSSQNIKSIYDTIDDAVTLKPVLQDGCKCYNLGYGVQGVVSMEDGGFVAFREVESADGKHYTERFLRTLATYGFEPKNGWIGYKPFSKFRGNTLFEMVDDIALQLDWDMELHYDSEVVGNIDEEEEEDRVPLKIYVASSWRNEYQQHVVEILRSWGHEVYDFKHPEGGASAGFHWSDIDADWKKWSPREYKQHLMDDKAEKGFSRDFAHLKWADICVLVLPCGSSAHAEAGWLKGAGRPTYVYIPEGVDVEPELMYKLFDGVACSDYQLWDMLNCWRRGVNTEHDIFTEYENRNGDLKVPKVEVYSLDVAATCWLLPRLRMLKEMVNNCGSTPCRCIDEFGMEDAPKKYDEILLKIITAFDLLQKEHDDGIHKRTEEESQKIKEGLALFAEYYDTLWV